MKRAHRENQNLINKYKIENETGPQNNIRTPIYISLDICVEAGWQTNKLFSVFEFSKHFCVCRLLEI